MPPPSGLSGLCVLYFQSLTREHVVWNENIRSTTQQMEDLSAAGWELLKLGVFPPLPGRFIMFLTHHLDKLWWKVNFKCGMNGQNLQHLSSKPAGGVKEYFTVFNNFQHGRKKPRRELSQTADVFPPGFIRNVTKDWSSQRACRTSRAGTTSSYPPRNTQILIRCIQTR